MPPNVHCLVEWLPERKKKKNSSKVSWARDTSAAFKWCVCVQVSRAVGVVMLPTAVILFAIQVVVRRL